ncbi:MAG TPA: DUF6064 family protein [Gemmatimonadaceae bacterium]|nr:DUF6064 family protein [Gemmatimonadaceae bacterium]
MSLPFSHDQFLDVFGAYNTLLWPAVVLLWLATAAIVWRWLRHGPVSARALLGLLAVHWAWSGIAYHWGFFRAINPAATFFAVLFVLQAALFTWLTTTGTARLLRPSGARGLVGVGLVLYGLLYPLLGMALGLGYPRLPLFAVPCPTTLVTTGLLLNTAGAPRIAWVVPILWAAIGSVGAFALDIHADLALLVAGAVLMLDMFAPSALGRRRAT